MNSEDQTQQDDVNQSENLDNTSGNMEDKIEDTSEQGMEEQSLNEQSTEQSDKPADDNIEGQQLNVTETQAPSVQGFVIEQPLITQPEITSAAPTVLDATLATQVNVQPTALEVEVPLVEEKGPVELSAFETYANKIKDTGTVAEKKLVSAIEHYLDAMQPGKPVEPNQGARNQYAFWRVIFNVVENSSQEEFKPLWKILLAYFNQFSKGGAFGHRHVYRFSEFWVNGESELNAYQKVLNVMSLTCDPATRSSGLTQFDINRSFDTVFTEVGRSRLIQFYQG